MRFAVHIHTLSQLREWGGSTVPDPVSAAAALDIAGADGIVCSLRENHDSTDGRDLELLKSMVKSHLSVEIDLNDTLLRQVMEIRPDQVTFVPKYITSREEGLDVVTNSDELERMIGSLQAAGTDVSVMVAPDITQIKEARKIGANYVTINAYSYTNAKTVQDAVINLEEIETVALGANRLGLRVLVMGGINHRNIGPIAAFDVIEEAILGHEVFARSLFTGMDKALNEVREAARWQRMNQS